MGTACAQTSLTIRFLNVGQGDAVLITAPEGQTLVYDGGRSEARMRELIRQYGINRVDVVVASHADSDHITGLIPIVALTKPKFFVNNGIAGTTDTWNRLMNVASLAGTQGIKVTNQTFDLGSVKITLNLYRVVGANTYRTDQNGTVTVTVQADGRYTITTERGTFTPGRAVTVTAPPARAPVTTPAPPRPSVPVYYRNCAEARAAGASPLLRGQPGYRPELDRDGDGRACE